MQRRSLLSAAIAAPLAGAAGALAIQSPAQAAWSSSDPWASWSNNGYRLYNNVWGQENGPGPQSIWANSYNNWGVWADHPNTGGIKSYPNVSYTLGRDVWSMGDVNSWHNVSVPSGSGLAYNTAYDVWGNGDDHEVMIWTQWRNVGPIGSFRTNVNLGGRSWSYYQGHNGHNPVYSFLARSQTTDAWVDITGHCQWLVRNGYMPRVRIDQIQFGWEITSSAGGRNFGVNGYSLNR